MDDYLIQSLDLSMIPVNESAILLDGKLLVMDNLDFPGRITPSNVMEDFKRRFPMKLSLNCILIVVKGTIRFSVNFRDYVAAAGTCAVITTGTIIEQVIIEDDSRCILLSFAHNDLPASVTYHQFNVHRLYALQVAQVPLLPQQLDMLISSYRMLRTILTDKVFAVMREETASHCVNLMASIIENGTDNQAAVTAKASRRDEIVARFLQCVHENYREHRDLGFYADQLCLSLKYMSHVIYEQTGRHPSRWIKDYVILDAKTMLRSGRYTVQQIADELHFPNQSFFGKYFKEAVGVSPKKWK